MAERTKPLPPTQRHIPDVIARQIEVPKSASDVRRAQRALQNYLLRIESQSRALPDALAEPLTMLFGLLSVREDVAPSADGFDAGQRREVFNTVESLRLALQRTAAQLDWEQMSATLGILSTFGLAEWLAPFRADLKALGAQETAAPVSDRRSMVPRSQVGASKALEVPTERRYVPPSRQGKSGFILYLADGTTTQLKQLASESGISLQKYLNDLIEEHIRSQQSSERIRLRRLAFSKRISASDKG